MPILFVHGRAQEKKNAEILHKTWRESMERGSPDLASVQSVFPYYGDQLAAMVPGPFQVDAELALRGSQRMDPHAGALATEITLEYADIAAARAAASRLSVQPRDVPISPDVDDLLRGKAPPPDPDAELRGRSLNSFLGVVDKVVPGASRLTVEFLRDVAVYLSNDDARNAVLATVSAEYQRCRDLAAKLDEPMVVIAHSLGSVVAHDLLFNEPVNSVALLMTLGSPLGVKTVQDRLLARRKGLAMWPRAAAAWVNASDPRDLVALVPAFGRSGFFGAPSKGSTQRCDVLNLVDLDNDTDNHHGISGYLDHPEVAAWILHFLH